MEAIKELEKTYRKPALPQLESGDTVRVHQLIREGNKQRVQVFEGVVIRRHRLDDLSACITVRRIASGVGVEKTFLLHSPNVSKIEILRRAKVRRNFLSYLRSRRGKSARLREISFDKVAANNVSVAQADDEVLDAEITEFEAGEDALDTAVPLSSEQASENREARSEDEPSSASDPEQADEQAMPAEEVDKGLDRADPGEGDAVSS